MRESSAERGIKDIDQGGEVSIPVDGVREPRFHRQRDGRRSAIIVLPGNKKFVERRHASEATQVRGGGRGSEGSPDGEGEDDFRFMLSREEYLDLFLDDLELPDLAKRALIGHRRASRSQRAGYSVTGSPANLAARADHAQQPVAPHRAAPAEARRDRGARREEIARARASRPATRSRPAPCRPGSTLLTAAPAGPLYRPDRSPLPAVRTHAEAGRASGDVLPDGRLGLDDRAHEGPGQAVLRAALPLPEAPLPPCRVVFIRHTHEAEEVDEETFFHSRETGGTVVSTALEKMQRIVAERYSPEDWNIYAAQASDGDNSPTDAEQTAALLQRRDPAALPVLRLSRGGQRRAVGAPASCAQASELWQTYENCEVAARSIRDAQGPPPARIYPVFRELFRATNETAERSAARHEQQVQRTLSVRGRGLGLSTRSAASTTRSRTIAIDELGLDIYPNQIEVITAEQMLDAYSSIGMPLFYKHWSFGKHFAHHETVYRKGCEGLAYEIVINSNPCITYIMEENSATMQTLVIAHAAFGHNHFFKNNYLFKQWTDADGILDYLEFAKGYIARVRGALRPGGGRAAARCRARADEPRRASLSAQARARPALRGAARARSGDRHRSRSITISGARCRATTQESARRTADEERRRALLELPQENILYFLEKTAPRLAAVAARDPAHRAHDRAVFLSADARPR